MCVCDHVHMKVNEYVCVRMYTLSVVYADVRSLSILGNTKRVQGIVEPSTPQQYKTTFKMRIICIMYFIIYLKPDVCIIIISMFSAGHRTKPHLFKWNTTKK